MMHSAFIVVLAVVVAGDAPANVEPSPGAQIPAAAPALSREVYPPDIKTESEYEGWLNAQHEAFSTAASTGSGGAASAIGLARHANWILAYYCEPAVTRLLLGLGTGDDAAALAARSQSASRLLQQATALDPQALNAAHVECLGGFAAALEQLGLSRQGLGDAAGLTSAAAGLSIWLDDDQPEVRETARLLQGLMYQESGNLAQALTILPRAVAPLEASDSAAALYARALRCQLQAAHGQPVAALALLLKMEEHCAEWLSPTRAPSGEALLSWLRLRIAEGYSQELGPAARQTLDVSMAQARSTAHAADHPGLLRLHPAVPLLFPGENAPPVQAHPRPPGKTGNRLEE